MKRARVLLADDQPMLAKLRKMLESDFEVVGMVSDGRSLVEAAFQWKPDIIVTDISMPILNGITAARKIRHVLPRMKFIFLTMHSDHGYRMAAAGVGASAYILKSSAREELVHAIHEATAVAA